MTGRGRRELPAAGRRDGAAVRRLVPTPVAPAGGRYVALERLSASLDGAERSPLRLAGGRRERPSSPRLPHALLLHLAHRAREAGDGGASIAAAAVFPDGPRLEALLGADRTQVADALDVLQRAGLLLAAGEGADGGPAGPLRLAASTLGADPRCAALDWRAVATATAGSPSAWVAAHALAERLDAHDWTPVARGGLEEALGCGVSGVRGALERLASTGLVERREQRGGVSVYRFTDLAWGRGRGATVPAPSVATVAPTPDRTVRPAAGTLAATGVRLVLGGVELEIPSGCRAQVVIGSDGRPTVTLG